MIEVKAEGLVKRFGRKQVLDHVNLALPAGGLWGLVGGDGAGKTTLLRILAGLLTPTSGKAMPGQAGQALVGFAQQGFHLYPDLTVGENLRFFGSVYGLRGHELANRADELLGFAGLRERRDSLAGQLSGGMRQKLTLACSLLHRPPILLLDEPTTGIDPLSRLEFWDLVQDLHARDATILLASAYFDEVERCDQVVYLRGGRIAAQGTPETLRGAFPSLEAAFVAAG